MKVFQVLFVVTVSLASCLGGNLPSDFKVCKRNDPKINECLKDAIQGALPQLQNGLPDLKIPELVPLHVSSATIGEGKGPVNVQQNFKNMKVYGVTNSVVDKAESSFTDDKFKITIDAHLPELKFDADYILNGRILLLPISGEGKCNVTATDVKAQLNVFGERYQKKGKDYIKVQDCKMTLDPGNVVFKFDNLFNGDETLGKQTNILLNDNWKELYQDVKPGYEELVCSVVSNYINNFFSKVPLEQLFPEK